MTAVEVQARHEAELGSNLGPVFHGLWQELATLHSDWHEFTELFATSPARIDVLNQAAPYHFYQYQRITWEAVLLRIRCMTDPPQTGQRENLTILRLPSLCSHVPSLEAKVQTLIKVAKTKCQFAREWSNRHIAHTDLDLSLGKSSQPLPPATRNHIDEAISAIHAVLNAISCDLMDCHMANEPPIIVSGGAVSLLHRLRTGNEADATRRERIKSGTYAEDDLRRRPPL